MKIGGMEVKSASDTAVTRLTGCIWAPAGTGKTTLACTAPGRKLIINLDPDGPASVGFRGDVDVIDLSSLPPDEIFLKLKSETNPLNLAEALEDDTYQTVILDSATLLAQKGLVQAVRERIGGSAKFTPTMEAPGISAYGARNAKVLTCLNGLLAVTGQHGKHFFCIAHEDDPEKDKEGNILYISIALGGKLVTGFAPKFSEFWWLQDAGDHFRLAIRNCRGRKPMKTRLFATDGPPEFSFDFDYEDWENPKENPIAQWWETFEKGGGKKVPLPTLAKGKGKK